MCSKAERAVQWAINIANDNSHGYSQSTRWGPSYDCSSLVISAFKHAGLPLQSTYTGDMYVDFLVNGFVDVTSRINLASGAGLQRGDVLLNTASHTALYLGDGRIVHARSSEGTADTWDGSGNEIRTQAYWNYPWNHVLRLRETEEEAPAAAEPGGDGICGPETWAALAERMPTVREGSVGWAVTALQAMLNALGSDLDADSEFGPLTYREVVAFQNRMKENET